MGILSFLLLFTVLRDVIYLTTQILFSPVYVLELTFISLFIGFVNAVRGPRIKRVNIPIQHLPDELVGFKISQISDLHIGATIRFPFVSKVVEKVNKLGPDLIVLTGDIGDGKVNKMWLYVNPGTGSWGPLIRLGTTPEITLLTLTQSKSDKELLT